MAHLFQVGAGSGGMPVLDMLCRDDRISHVTLVEPDVYKPHNVVRHIFPAAAVGQFKADLARDWLLERRPEMQIDVLRADLLDPAQAERIETAVRQADIGVCAVDNEPAKYHFDALFRRNRKPWTLGEVLSGGIGGFVHWFVPEGACYGCVASYLKRSVTVDKPSVPDYSQPGAAMEEATIPASKAAIEVITSLHALITLQLLDALTPDPSPSGRGAGVLTPDPSPSERGAGVRAATFDPGFTSMLLPLVRVPDVFAEPFRPFRFRIPRSPECLICRPGSESTSQGEDLDRALDQALGRLGP